VSAGWKRSVAVLVFLCAVMALVVAQQVPTFTAEVKVVNVLATVRDKHGQIVNSLTKDDFILEEDGRPQTIRYFARETDLPLTLGLLVDTSGSQLQQLDSEKRASATFVNDVLREGKDSAFLIHFDREVELLQDITSSRAKMADALQLLQAAQNGGRRGGGGYPGGGGRGGGYPGGRGGGSGQTGRGGPGDGTHLYDSIFLAADELMAKQQGRKAIVVLTDGVDHGSKMSLEQAIETAQRADTMVYSIYFEGREGGYRRAGGGWGGGRRGGGWPGGGGGWPGGSGGRWPGGGGGGSPRPSGEAAADGKKVLERLSQETGGRMFVVSKKEAIEQIYAQIQDELRNQYNLGYTPDRAANDGPDYRHIRVTTKEKDLRVQAREGYYASRQLGARPGE
jgi:VWFA-related protein